MYLINYKPVHILLPCAGKIEFSTFYIGKLGDFLRRQNLEGGLTRDSDRPSSTSDLSLYGKRFPEFFLNNVFDRIFGLVTKLVVLFVLSNES